MKIKFIVKNEKINSYQVYEDTDTPDLLPNEYLYSGVSYLNKFNRGLLIYDPDLNIVRDITPEDKPKVYNANDLIVWAIVQFPEFIGTAHEYVLTTFASNPVEYKDFMLQRATIIDTGNGNTIFTDIANALIAKAIELGAPIGE